MSADLELAEALDKIRVALRDAGYDVERDEDGDPLTIHVYDEATSHYVALTAGRSGQ